MTKGQSKDANNGQQRARRGEQYVRVGPTLTLHALGEAYALPIIPADLLRRGDGEAQLFRHAEIVPIRPVRDYLPVPDREDVDALHGVVLVRRGNIVQDAAKDRRVLRRARVDPVTHGPDHDLVTHRDDVLDRITLLEGMEAAQDAADRLRWGGTSQRSSHDA